ncbi:MAG: hypothetical protein V7638_2615 [Acidobacteriota bacterium]|jgi:hypothetical protein
MSSPLAGDTKFLQDMADEMLPHFDNMPQVVVLVEDNEVFHRDLYPAAVYSCPNILINPRYAMFCSYNDIQGLICHELIHAWLDWKGLLGRGEHLDEHHSELFVKKALEINQKRIRNLNVDIDYLLKNSEDVDIYNRLAGIQFAPYLRHKVRKVAKPILPLIIQMVKAVWGYERIPRALLISFSTVIIGLVLSKARVIPGGVAALLWTGWAAGVLIWYAVSMIRQRRQ